MMTGQILFHFRMQPPGTDDGGTNGHFKSPFCQVFWLGGLLKIGGVSPRFVPGRFRSGTIAATEVFGSTTAHRRADGIAHAQLVFSLAGT
jgi:hypothetical protein